METMVGLGTVEFEKKFFTGYVLRSIRQGADWVVVIDVVIWNQIVNFPQIHQQSQFNIGFFAQILDWRTLRMIMLL